MAHEYQPCPETDDEILPVVDWDDREIGTATRREIHQKAMLHRAVHVILTRGDGKFLLSRRSMQKDSHPGIWDISVGGHVSPGEAYIETAIRECAEEMGVTGIQPLLVTIFPPSITNGWEHIHVFVASIEGDPKPNPLEVSEVRWIAKDEFLKEFNPGPDEIDFGFSPAGYDSIEKWLRLQKK